jgi:hypothetical protein
VIRIKYMEKEKKRCFLCKKEKAFLHEIVIPSMDEEGDDLVVPMGTPTYTSPTFAIPPFLRYTPIRENSSHLFSLPSLHQILHPDRNISGRNVGIAKLISPNYPPFGLQIRTANARIAGKVKPPRVRRDRDKVEAKI